MSYYIKKVLKTILIILLILLAVGVCCRYQKLKSEGKLNELFVSDKTSDYYKADGSEYINDTISKENIDQTSTIENNSEEIEVVVEEKDYDGYYYNFSFDNRLLLYEGVQSSVSIKEAFNLLITDADDPMYGKPTVILKNFSGLSTNKITEENLEEYKNVLNQAMNSLGNGTYTLSFEYNKLKTRVSTIIIEKN